MPEEYVFDGKLFDVRLQCVVYAVEYDFKSRVGKLVMSNESCCDMHECINLFKSIDPKVKSIKTYAGKLLDTCYDMDGQNIWRVIQF